MPRRAVTSSVVVDQNISDTTTIRMFGPNTHFDGVIFGSIDPGAMIVRSTWEVANEGAWPAPHVMRFGGEFEQCWPCVARWDADPDVVMWAHDIGGHWISRNAGRTTRHTRSKGFGCIGVAGIQMHPVTGRVVSLAISNYLGAPQGGGAPGKTFAFEGLYTSDDFGETWVHRQEAHMGRDHNLPGEVPNAEPTYVMRSATDVIKFDKWWTPDRVVACVGGEGIYTSLDAGNNWVRKIDLESNADVHDCYRLILSRKVQGRAFLACGGLGVGTATQKHAGLIRIDDLWGSSPTLIRMDDGLPDPANNVFTSDLGNGAGHIRWIDFANPVTQDGDLIVSSVENGAYRIPMSATHTATGVATQWIADPLMTKLTVCDANPLIMGRFSKAQAPTPRRLRTTVDGGTTWQVGTVHEQPASWRTSGWKTQVGGQWDTSTWHPGKPAGELLFHSSAMNWLCHNFTGTGSDIVPCNDYIGGWNSAGGYSRSDFAAPGLHAQGFQDHGVAVSVDNGRTLMHLNSPSNLEAGGSANGSSNGAAFLPGSDIVFASIGDHQLQQTFRGSNYNLAEACVWTKVGDTDLDGIIEAGEGSNSLKQRPVSFFLPGTDYWYSGNQRSAGTNPTTHNNIGTPFTATAEMIGYTKVDKVGANIWVVWAATFYGGGTGDHQAGKAIWRGTVNPPVSGNTINWDSTVTAYYLAPSGNMWADGFAFSPDHQDNTIIYVKHHTTGGIARWNGTTLTDLGLMSHPDLTGDAAWNGVSSIAIDPLDTDNCMVLTRQPGYPCVWFTENLTSATPTWVPATNFSHLGTGTADLDPHTGERIYDGPFGRFVFPPPTGVSRGNPLRGANAVRYSTVDWEAP